jgi:cytosine permease
LSKGFYKGIIIYFFKGGKMMMLEKIKQWWSFDEEKEGKSVDSVHEPLSFDKRRKAIPLLILGFTWGFLVTGLLIGGILGPQMPFYTGTIPSIIIGCIILFIVGTLTGLVGYKIGGTNDMAFQYAFGKKGRWLPSIFLFIVVMGFQGIVVGGTAAFWLKDTNHPAFFWVALLFGIIFTYTCYVGITAIEKVANPSMILLILISFYAIYYNISQIGGWGAFNQKTIDLATSSPDGPMSLAMGINIVIGSWIAGAVMTSDFTRFAKNKWVAMGLIAGNFIVAQFFLMPMGAIGAVISGTFDFTQYLSIVSPIIGFIALVAMTLAMWTTSNTNLYLPSTQVASIFKRPFKVAVVICGAIGTLMGALGFYQTFQPFVLFIGIILPPLAGPMIADFWIIHRTNYKAEYYKSLPELNVPSVLAAIIGAFITLLATGIPAFGFQPVAFLVKPWIVPAVLGIIVSIVAYVILFYVFKSLGINSGYAKAIENNKNIEVVDTPAFVE